MMEMMPWKRLLTMIVIGNNCTGDEMSNAKSGSGCSGGKKANEKESRVYGFQMPLHYPRYKKRDYERMEEWKIDSLLKQYGLADFQGQLALEEKRAYVIGAFLWPDQLHSDD